MNRKKPGSRRLARVGLRACLAGVAAAALALVGVGCGGARPPAEQPGDSAKPPAQRPMAQRRQVRVSRGERKPDAVPGQLAATHEPGALQGLHWTLNTWEGLDPGSLTVGEVRQRALTFSPSQEEFRKAAFSAPLRQPADASQVDALATTAMASVEGVRLACYMEVGPEGTYYESIPAALSTEPTVLVYPLRKATWKSADTDWQHEAAAPATGQIRTVGFVVYGLPAEGSVRVLDLDWSEEDRKPAD